MAIILYSDALKRSVEVMSGGLQTALKTPSGTAAIMNVFTQENIETVVPALSSAVGITGTHPVFKVGNKTAKKIYIGTYEANIRNGELTSIPGVLGCIGKTDLEGWMRSNTMETGAGWHAMTNMEWQYILHKLVQSGYPAYSANATGVADANSALYGMRGDGYAPGATITNPSNPNDMYGARFNAQILNGSGPVEFRLGGKFYGLDNLFSGGKNKLPKGIRLIGNPTDGFECQVKVDNNGAAIVLPGNFQSEADTGWLAFDASTGALVTPTFTGTVAANNYVPTTKNSVRILFGGTAPSTAPANLVYANFASNGTLSNYGQVPKAVMDKIAFYGFWAHPALAAAGYAGSTGQWSWAGSAPYDNNYGGAVQECFVGSQTPFNKTYTWSGYGDYPVSTRLCYIDPADLS